jgi:hypothetical protein
MSLLGKPKQRIMAVVAAAGMRVFLTVIQQMLDASQCSSVGTGCGAVQGLHHIKNANRDQHTPVDH